MKPDDHWFSQYFAQDHAGNIVDILIELSKTTRETSNEKKGAKKHDSHSQKK